MGEYFSNLTKIKIMEDVLRHYYRCDSEEAQNSKLGHDLKQIEEKEPYYYKALEILYKENRMLCEAAVRLYCSERTITRKRNAMLLELYNATFPSEVA